MANFANLAGKYPDAYTSPIGRACVHSEVLVAISEKRSRACTFPAGRTRVHLEVLMHVSQEFDHSTEAGGDPAEGATQRVYTEDCAVSSPSASDKPDLVIDPADLPASAYRLRDLLAKSGELFERGVPVKVVPGTDGGPPMAVSLTVNDVLFEAHRLSRPVKHWSATSWYRSPCWIVWHACTSK
jgi:hypothetical protein